MFDMADVLTLLHFIGFFPSFTVLTLLDLTHEQVVHGSMEWIGLYEMQLYSKSLFFELEKWNFGSSIVLVSF